MSNLSPAQQSQFIYGPILPGTTLQTPNEDLYDEGAGAVWGSLSDEGSPSSNSPGGTLNGTGTADLGFDTSGVNDIPTPETGDFPSADYGDITPGDYGPGDYGPGDAGVNDMPLPETGDFPSADYGDITPGDTGPGDIGPGDIGPGDDGAGDNGTDGGPEEPVVSIMQGGNIAYERQLVGQDFARTHRVFVRRSGDTSGALTVFLSYAGTATIGVDYTGAQRVVVFPANYDQVSFEMMAVDDMVVEGKEMVTVTLDENAAYERGTFEDSFEIKDRAAVKEVKFESSKTKRSGTNLALDVPQDYQITVRAIPTDGGEFALGDIEWTLNPGDDGQTLGTISDVHSDFILLTLNRFQVAPAILKVKTAVGGPVQSSLEIIPHPTTVGNSYREDTVLRSHPPMTNDLSQQYGGGFGTVVTPSNGATGFDLAVANSSGLKVKRVLTSSDARIKFSDRDFKLENSYALEEPQSLNRDLVGDNTVILNDLAIQATKMYQVNSVTLQVENGTPIDFLAKYSYQINTPDYDTGMVPFGQTTPKLSLTHPSAGYSVITSAGQDSEVYDQYLIAHDGTHIDTGGPRVEVWISKPELHNSEWATVTVSGIIPETHRFGGASVELYAGLTWFNDGTVLDKGWLSFHNAALCSGNTPFSATFRVQNVGQNLVGRVGSVNAGGWDVRVYAKLRVLQAVGSLYDWSDNNFWIKLLEN